MDGDGVRRLAAPGDRSRANRRRDVTTDEHSGEIRSPFVLQLQ